MKHLLYYEFQIQIISSKIIQISSAETVFWNSVFPDTELRWNTEFCEIQQKVVYVKRCIWTDTEFLPVCRTHHNKSKYSVFQKNSEIGEIQSFPVSPNGP